MNAAELTPSIAEKSWYSYLDVQPWTDVPEDDSTWEEIRGRKVEKKMGAHESSLANILSKYLLQYLQIYPIGDVYITMEILLPKSGNKRVPDLAFISSQQWPIGKPAPSESAYWKIVPEMATEVVSPSELTRATHTKVQEYFDEGVKTVWLVFPDIKQFHIYSSPTNVMILTQKDDLTYESLFPGFKLPLVKLFPR